MSITLSNINHITFIRRKNNAILDIDLRIVISNYLI